MADALPWAIVRRSDGAIMERFATFDLASLELRSWINRRSYRVMEFVVEGPDRTAAEPSAELPALYRTGWGRRYKASRYW